MAHKIILKKSSVVDKVPLAEDIDYGELALNYTDGRLFYKDSFNNIKPYGIVHVGTTPPASPKINEIWLDTNTGKSYIYYNDGTSVQWVLFANPVVADGDIGYTGSRGAVKIDVSSSPPVSPSAGDVWIDDNTGTQYFFFDDGDSQQWVELSNTGVAGSRGPNGYTGSRGPIGYTGSQGGQGDVGFTGSQGGQGDVGFTGSQGGQGEIGFTGSQGIIGYTGSQGDVGFTGSRGTTGFTGSVGAVGVNIVSQSYVWASNGATSTPGIFNTDSTSISSTTQIITYKTDGIGTDLTIPWNNAAQFTNWYVRYFLANGAYVDFKVTAVVNNTAYLTLTVEYVTSTLSTNVWSTAAPFSEYLATIPAAGSTGFTGSQGDIGFTGSQGDIGFTGSQGDIGFTGSQGDIGFTGSKGTDGTSVTILGVVATSTSLPGYPSSYGGSTGDAYITEDTGHLWVWGTSTWIDAGEIRGPSGYTGSQGDQGVIGYTGSQGDQGVIGYTGSQGDQGGIGYTGSIGDQGVIGYTGSQGEIGFTGSQGDQGVIGYTGSIGDIGYTGSSGNDGIVAPYIVKTSNYTALSNDRILADTSGGTFTITLPASPSTGTTVEIADGSDFYLDNLIVARNGSTIEGIADDVFLDISQATFTFIYSGTTWEVVTTAGPKGNPAEAPAINVVMNGGGAALNAGTYAYINIEYDSIIEGWKLFSDTSDTVSITISKATYSSFPTFTNTSIDPSLVNSQKNSATGLFVLVNAGDILRIAIDANTSSSLITLSLNVQPF